MPWSRLHTSGGCDWPASIGGHLGQCAVVPLGVTIDLYSIQVYGVTHI